VITPEFAVLSPTVQAAVTVENIERSRLGQDYRQLDINLLIDLLVKSTKRFHYDDIRGIECGLLGQAATLNLIFNQFVRRGVEAFHNDERESEFRIAFRAQSQYRATLATLAAIKNPGAVAFVNQANIAHGPQQVNNSCTVRNTPRMRRKTKFRPNKQSGRKRELLPNPRASAVKSDADSRMEALGTIDGTKDDRG
jgi:hypothetical protein